MVIGNQAGGSFQPAAKLPLLNFQVQHTIYQLLITSFHGEFSQ
jgi:hypothetical protein